MAFQQLFNCFSLCGVLSPLFVTRQFSVIVYIMSKHLRRTVPMNSCHFQSCTITGEDMANHNCSS